jgi:hypothetical protein
MKLSPKRNLKRNKRNQRNQRKWNIKAQSKCREAKRTRGYSQGVRGIWVLSELDLFHLLNQLNQAIVMLL